MFAHMRIRWLIAVWIVASYVMVLGTGTLSAQSPSDVALIPPPVVPLPQGILPKTPEPRSGDPLTPPIPKAGTPSASPAVPLPSLTLPAGALGGRLALVPNMLGDTTSGACGGLNFGGVLRVGIDHPTFGCSRLNIAENNSPLPRDRIYFRYNNFKNESSTDIFSDTPRGTQSSIDIDRYTFGFEKTFFGGRFSTELRMQVNDQLTSQLSLYDFNGVTNLPLDERQINVGNLGWINKFLVYHSEVWNISGGLGVNIPTERAVRIDVQVHDQAFVLVDPTPSFPFTITAPAIGHFAGTVRNETVNLSPFVGALYTPNDALFMHGFAQLDVPVNKSKADVSGFTVVDVPGLGRSSSVTPYDYGFLKQQMLMRFNAGAGYWVYKNPCGRWLTGFAPTFEAHYTTTIEDADLLIQPLNFFPGSSTDLTVGNLKNRRDVFNLTFGGTFLLEDRGLLGVGIVVPLSTGSNKPFDYELTAQFSWLFGPNTRASRAGS